MPDAYHSTKLMRENVRISRDRVLTAVKRAELNLSPNLSRLQAVAVELTAILAAEEGVTFVRLQPQVEVSPPAEDVAQQEAQAAEAQAAEEIARQAAAMAAEVDARLAAQAEETPAPVVEEVAAVISPEEHPSRRRGGRRH